jgi:hypothetical protein
MKSEWSTAGSSAQAGVPQILASALLVISIAAYAQESSDKPIISLATVDGSRGAGALGPITAGGIPMNKYKIAVLRGYRCEYPEATRHILEAHYEPFGSSTHLLFCIM